MRQERRNVPAPTNHFITFKPISLPARDVVTDHVEPVGKRWAFGSFVCLAERNPMKGKRILALVELRVPACHDPVVAFGHGRILTERNAPQLLGKLPDTVAEFLGPEQEKGMMCEIEVQVANSG
jgi:hypothetical protein